MILAADGIFSSSLTSEKVYFRLLQNANKTKYFYVAIVLSMLNHIRRQKKTCKRKNDLLKIYRFMVDVAQLAEHRVVAPVAEGSSPFIHPYFFVRP